MFRHTVLRFARILLLPTAMIGLLIAALTVVIADQPKAALPRLTPAARSSTSTQEATSLQDDCDPTSPYISECSCVTEPGDLVLTGTEVLIIEDITYSHHGNICLQDNAKLLIHNGTLDIQLDYHGQFYIYLLDNASLEISDGSTRGPEGFQLWLQDAAAVTATNAVFGGAEIRAYDHASLYAIDSQMEGIIGGAADHWPYEETDYATFELVDSSVGILCLYFDAWSGGTVHGLHPGLYSDWDLQRDNEIQWLPYNVILRNSVVEIVWDVACNDASTLTLVDSQLYQFAIWDEAVATLQDCVVERGIFIFTDPPISAVSFDGLQPGHFDDWSLRDPEHEEPYRFNLVIHNSDVNNWYLRTHDTDLSVSDSTVGVLRMGGDTQAAVDNSTIGDFWVWGYNGTVTFTNSIMQNWYETRWCDFWMNGTVTIEGGTIIDSANGPWTDGTIHREYPVEVRENGIPLPDASLELKAQDGGIVWTGNSDTDGTASFTLTFTETNYLHTWTLSAAGEDFSLQRGVRITSTTPVELNLLPVPLSQGWNIVSIPVSPLSPVITDVLSTIEGNYDLVYAYHASDAADPWKKYNTAAPSFLNDLTEIDETMGVWIRATEPVTLTVSGSVPSSTDISLYTGWNLVGYPSQTTRPTAEALVSIAGKYDLVYAYDAWDAEDPWKKYNTAAPSFLNDLTEMGPGWGYWIRVSEDCVWSVP